MRRIRLSALETAARFRAHGYFAEVISKSRAPSSPGTDGTEWVEIDEADYKALRLKYEKKQEPGKLGLGDVVAIAAKPIARVIDKAFGTNLENCPSCAKRQKWLNSAWNKTLQRNDDKSTL